MIEIGAFLAIYFDVDEMLVHDCGGLFVFKTFALHYMTPVTGGIADAYENGFILLLSGGECLIAPGIPVYGVMSVLKKIGAGLCCEAVRMCRHLNEVRSINLPGKKEILSNWTGKNDLGG